MTERDDAAGDARHAEHLARAERRMEDRILARIAPRLLDGLEGKEPLPETAQKGPATPPWWVLAIGGVLIAGVLNPLVASLTAAGSYGDKITALTTTVGTLAAKVDQIVDRSGQSVSKLDGAVQAMQFQILALQKVQDEDRAAAATLSRALNDGEKSDAEEKARITALEQRTQNMIDAMRQLRQDMEAGRPRQYPDAEPQHDRDSQTGSWPGAPAQEEPFEQAAL